MRILTIPHWLFVFNVSQADVFHGPSYFLIAPRPAVPRVGGEKKLGWALRCKLGYRAGEDPTVYGAQHARLIAWSWVTSATLVSP